VKEQIASYSISNSRSLDFFSSLTTRLIQIIV
jgi:hypothetical protein